MSVIIICKLCGRQGVAETYSAEDYFRLVLRRYRVGDIDIQELVPGYCSDECMLTDAMYGIATSSKFKEDWRLQFIDKAKELYEGRKRLCKQGG